MAQRPPPASSPPQQLRLTSTFSVVALLFVLALVLTALFELDRSRHEAEQRAAHEIEALARVFAEQTRRSLQTVDIMLRGLVEAQRDQKLPPLDSPQMHEQLVAQRDQFSDVAAVFLTDAHGTRLNSSTAFPSPNASVEGGVLVRGLQARAPSDAFVAQSVRWMTTGRWVVPLARRLEGPGGRLDGVVGALLDASYFENFYAAVQLERGTSVALLGEGATLVAKFPAEGQKVGQPVPEYRDLRREDGLGTEPTVLPGGHGVSDRIAVARQVPGFDMTIVVARERREVLAAWHEQVFSVALRTVFLALMVGALLVIVRRHFARVNAARALVRESEERYALAVAGANEGLWDWNLMTGDLFFSERAQQLAGMRPGPPLRPRRSWQAGLAVHPEDVPRMRQEMRAHLHGRRAHFDVEFRAALRRDGGAEASGREPDWHWYRQRGVAIRDERGRPCRMAGSVENIDERKRSERERQRLEGQLRQAQKLEAIGTLAGGIAHDFNNILGAILGYGELARSSAAPESALARHLDGVMNAGLRAKALVERILAFSRSGMGERVPVHVQSVVAEALDLLLPSLPEGIELKRRLEAGDTAVIGDATQIHQVVMNLCTNAMHAMQHAGTLSVSLELRRSEQVVSLTTGALPAGDYVCLVVADQGEGIEPDVVHRIFDPFFTTKGVGVGTGLGLSLVHGIVTDLGGGIDVKSALGAGTTFTVWLPWSGRAAAHVQGVAAVPLGKGERVLLVDDELALVQLGEEMLAALGYEPAGYTSSVEALAAFEAEPERFDAVLTDETMPHMSGSQLTARMRRIRPDIPILLMSGYVGANIAALARQANVNELLAKPLVSGDIAKALARAFAR
ncbi:MAG TPA: ATP-binding protein [Caldimonas sp.]|jgi:signal transduction histidine kinase/flagellar biogenesis protein FliO|nr:ATP-binding protein [Caldimonas sp.]